MIRKVALFMVISTVQIWYRISILYTVLYRTVVDLTVYDTVRYGTVPYGTVPYCRDKARYPHVPCLYLHVYTRACSIYTAR